MTSIYAIPAELSAKPSRIIRKDHDDSIVSLAFHDAATPAQFVAAAVVDSDLPGAADRLAGALWPALQAGSRVARLRSQFLYQFRHSWRSHYVGSVRRRLERYGSDYGHEC